MKSLEEKKQEQQKEETDVTEYLRQKHIDNQTKEVQKRMKKSRKKAEKHNKNKRPLFKKSWFRK